MGAHTGVSRTSYGLGAVLFALSLAQAARAQQHVGYVLEMGGTWQLGSQRISKGDQLPAGGVVSIQSPASDDHIVILDNNGRLLARRRCKVPDECGRPIVLPRANRARQSSAGILLDSVVKLLWGEPEKYILLRSRDQDLMDAVVRLDREKLDLGPALKQMAATDYHLRMREVAGDGKSGAWLKPFALKLNPSAPAVVAAPGLRPGLYEVASFSNANGVYIPTGDSAWVLVREGTEFEKAAAAEQEALALLAQWGDDVSSEVKRGFVRAHLSHLSRQAGK